MWLGVYFNDPDGHGLEVYYEEPGGYRRAWEDQYSRKLEGVTAEASHSSPDSTYKDRVRTTAYPVQAVGGLIWAYLGPAPAPLLPRLDLCEQEHGLRQIVGHRLPCNWLQVMENRGDQHHGIYLHGRLFQYALERQGRLTDDPSGRYNSTMHQQADRQRRGAYPMVQIVYNTHGFTKGVRDSDAPEDVWQLGGPVLFPYLVYPALDPKVGGDERGERRSVAKTPA